MYASACIYMCCNNQMNIMKIQAGHPDLGSRGKYLCIFFYVLCSRHCIFSVLRIRFQVILYRVKTYIWYKRSFDFKGMHLLLKVFSRACGRPCLVGDLQDQFLG